LIIHAVEQTISTSNQMNYSIQNGLFILTMSGDESQYNNWKVASSILEKFVAHSIKGDIEKIILDLYHLKRIDDENLDNAAKLFCTAVNNLTVKRVIVIVPNDKITGTRSWYKLRKKMYNCTKYLVEVPSTYIKYSLMR